MKIARPASYTIVDNLEAVRLVWHMSRNPLWKGTTHITGFL
jgi:hypothetical protein